jgi:tetratricopeptide (TPR) repeat protein
VIFDLKSGKRRRVVQIVFGFLAFIFFISFVGFGIGSDVSGGIFDAIGLGGDDNNTDIESTYEQQIDDAQKKLDDNPKDEKALTNLARYRYLAGQENLSFDEESGVASITDDARSEWDSALDAWEKLTKQQPDKLDVQVASQMICAYVPPLPACAVQAPLDQVNLQGAAATQKLLAEQEDTAAAYGELASFYYFDGDVKSGDAARDEALSRANASETKQLEKGLEQLRKQAEKFVEQQKAAAKAGDTDSEPQLENPFGGIGADTGGIPPASAP